MKTEVPAIIIFQNRYDLLSYAPMDSVGKAILALLDINSGGSLPDFQKGTQEAMIFNCLYNDYLQNKAKYESEHQKRVEAGKKGGDASAESRWGYKKDDTTVDF